MRSSANLWLLMGLLVVMAVMRAMISSMHIDISSWHTTAEKHVEQLLGGNVRLEASGVVLVIMVTSAGGAGMGFRLVGAV